MAKDTYGAWGVILTYRGTKSIGNLSNNWNP